jgi:hypothetical protein
MGILVAVMAIDMVTRLSADGRQPVLTFGPRSRELLRAAVAASPTVASLVEALAPTDIIVVIEVTRQGFGAAGDLRIQAIAGNVRYLRIRVSGTLEPWDQMAILGHELQHANEVAQAPDVRDQAGLARLMRRIGRETLRGAFDTNAAAKTTAQVRREVAR